MLCRLLVALAVAAAVAPALAQDPGDMVLRIGRLENQLRQMAGQIEQLQFDNRRLADQLKKFQDDVEFRFQERSGGGSTRSAPQTTAPAPSVTPREAPAPRGQRRSDVFDPAEDPAAPGSPRPLGSRDSASVPPTVAPSGIPRGAIETDGRGIGDILDDDEDAEGSRRQRRFSAAPDAPLDLDGRGRRTEAPPASPSVAAIGGGSAREDYEGAYASVLQRRYDQAEMGFRRFLQSHPRDKLVPEATYWLGESYFQRGRYREAAEQFLKVTTDYSSTAKAPDGLLKLGMSLNGIGARDQACATYGEMSRKYPSASAELRGAVEREKRRAKC